MTRTEKIQRRTAEILAEAIDKEMAPMLYAVACAQVEDELGLPPYKPFDCSMHARVVIDGVPVKDL